MYAMFQLTPELEAVKLIAFVHKLPTKEVRLLLNNSECKVEPVVLSDCFLNGETVDMTVVYTEDTARLAIC